MVHRFTTTAEVAHKLTKQSKKQGFYFRTLSRTDNTDVVSCEVTEHGYEYIQQNEIPVIEWKDNRGGYRPNAGRKKTTERDVPIMVRITKDAAEKLKRLTDNKSEYIDKLIMQQPE